MPSQKQARTFALLLPQACVDAHRGRPDVRVGTKIFTTFPPDGLLVVKTTPANLEALTRLDPETFKSVWGDRWIGVELERLAAVRDFEANGGVRR
jgi:hypothetical protein